MELGHAGVAATTSYLKDHCKWSGTLRNLRRVLCQCQACQRFASRVSIKPTTRLKLGDPFYRVGIDMVGPLPKTERGNQFIVVVTDHLTRQCEVRALKNKTAKEVAKFLYEEILSRHRPPAVLLSDRGCEFVNSAVRENCKRPGTVRSMTAAYHPQCNGAVEWLNRTIMAKLAKLCNGDVLRWDEFHHAACFCYRISPIHWLRASPF